MPQEPLTQLGQRAPNWDQTGKYWELESPSCQVAAGRFAKLEARGQGWGVVWERSEPSPKRSRSYPPRKEGSKPKMQSTSILGIFSGRVPRARTVASRAGSLPVDLRSPFDTLFREGNPGKGGEVFLRESALHAAGHWVAVNAPSWWVGWGEKNSAQVPPR